MYSEFKIVYFLLNNLKMTSSGVFLSQSLLLLLEYGYCVLHSHLWSPGSQSRASEYTGPLALSYIWGNSTVCIFKWTARTVYLWVVDWLWGAILGQKCQGRFFCHKFCFPLCSEFWQGWISQQEIEDKWWQILPRTLNILETVKFSLDFLLRYFIFPIAEKTFYLLL